MIEKFLFELDLGGELVAQGRELRVNLEVDQDAADLFVEAGLEVFFLLSQDFPDGGDGLGVVGLKGMLNVRV